MDNRRYNSRTAKFELHGKSIEFDCPSQLSLDRVTYLLDKEPGTIAWIDRFEPGSIFWDVGANIGTFSLYAAVLRGCRVFAFEPAAQNYFVLNRNIARNRLDESVKALCVAIDRRSTVSALNMRDDVVGSALHTFGESVDYKGDAFRAVFLQGCLGVSIDSLCADFGMATPQYIKVDVDGLERAVVAGGSNVFRDAACRSVLVELDLNDADEVREIAACLTQCGFREDRSVPGNVPRKHPKALIYNMIFSKR
jgi:FkbM family methyltransferase